MSDLMRAFAPLSYVAAFYAVALAGLSIVLVLAEIALRQTIRAGRSAGGSQ